jgi:ATP-dependent DNA ligase
MNLPVMPPVRPMLAKATLEFPVESDLVFEPKWDGYRCIVFRDGDEVVLGSRNDKPLTRYFPELLDPIRTMFPGRAVIDGEIVVPIGAALDFDALGQRIHPAESRVNRLAEETPAWFVAFDVLAVEDRDFRPEPFAARRAVLETLAAEWSPPLIMTPSTTDLSTAQDWFARFEGAGFDGVMAKPAGGEYQANKRVQWKIKHRRLADVVVAGYRRHKDGDGVGSLLLGLYGDDQRLHHIGVASAFSAQRRAELVAELADWEFRDGDVHPWHDWAQATAHEDGQRRPGAPSRWSGSNKDPEWIPLRMGLVAEVTFEGLTHGRLRHPARLVRWRPDRSPESCSYHQLDEDPPAELAELFG